MTTLCELLRGLDQGLAGPLAIRGSAAAAAQQPEQALPDQQDDSASSSPDTLTATDDIMARLAADADAAMAADFADTWAAAESDAAARLGPVIEDPYDIAAPMLALSLDSDTVSSQAARLTVKTTPSEQVSHMAPVQLWQLACPTLRSILRCVVQVFEDAAAASSTDAQHQRGSSEDAVSQLSVPAVLHARMLCTLVGTIAVHAPEALRHDAAMLRSTLLPLLQCTVSLSTAVSTIAMAAVDAVCAGALFELAARNDVLPASWPQECYALHSFNMVYFEQKGVVCKMRS